MLNGLYQEILNLTISSLAILPTPIVLGILCIGNVKWPVSRDFKSDTLHPRHPPHTSCPRHPLHR
jgi:hypothetical protein